jgi:hypothetical protein
MRTAPFETHILDNHRLILHAARRSATSTAQGPDVVLILDAWDLIFCDTDRMRTALPRRARFTTDEALIEFTRRAGGPKTLEERNILDMMIQKKS